MLSVRIQGYRLGYRYPRDPRRKRPLYPSDILIPRVLEPHSKASARDEAAAGEAVAEAAAETVVFSGMRAPLLFWLGRLAWAERFPVVPHRGLYVNGSFHVRTATVQI